MVRREILRQVKRLVKHTLVEGEMGRIPFRPTHLPRPML